MGPCMCQGDVIKKTWQSIVSLRYVSFDHEMLLYVGALQGAAGIWGNLSCHSASHLVGVTSDMGTFTS
jgi:hypothetical protein